MRAVSPFARRYGRRRAEDRMADTVVITRSVNAALDELTLVATAPASEVLYRGKASIWTSSSRSSASLGDAAQLATRTTMISLPVSCPALAIDDVVEVKACLSDPALVGKTGAVADVTAGKRQGLTRQATLTGLYESGAWSGL